MWRTSRWSRHALSYNDGGGDTEMRTLAMVLAMAFVAAGFSSARAEVKAEVVEYRHGDAVLEGYLAYDAAFAGNRPGVVVVHEWMGHNPYVRKRAEQLARLGYVAFALDMYGKGVRAKDAKEAAALAGKFKGGRAVGRGGGGRGGLAIRLPRRRRAPLHQPGRGERQLEGGGIQRARGPPILGSDEELLRGNPQVKGEMPPVFPAVGVPQQREARNGVLPGALVRVE